MTESPAKTPEKVSDTMILIALVTLAEMLVLVGIAIGYFITKSDTWIHVGVAVLVLFGGAVAFLSWQEAKAKKGKVQKGIGNA
jgi:hypothetical protein